MGSWLIDCSTVVSKAAAELVIGESELNNAIKN